MAMEATEEGGMIEFFREVRKHSRELGVWYALALVFYVWAVARIWRRA